MSTGRMWFGIVLIVFGVLFLLDSTGVIGFRYVMRSFWPLLLVGWGVWLLFRGGRRTPPPPPVSKVFEDRNKIHTSGGIHSSNVFGNLALNVDAVDFSGGTVSNVFGDIRMDLSKATIAEGESVLRVDGVFGTTHITLPADIEYAFYASTVFGDVERNSERHEGFSPRLEYQTPGYANAPRKLRIVASEVFGDIVVRN